MIRLRPWSRREWLATHATVIASAAVPQPLIAAPVTARVGASARRHVHHAALVPSNAADRIDADAWEAIAARAVDAATQAGAQYADARLTRLVQQHFKFREDQYFDRDSTVVGMSVRALVNGYWGYAARAGLDADRVVRLAQDAVAQAKTNAKGSPRTVELGHIPVARGRWETPVKIDPFTVPVSEKQDLMRGWYELDRRLWPLRRLPPDVVGGPNHRVGSEIEAWMVSTFNFARQERVVATSEGARFTQTLFESGGLLEYEQSATEILGISPAAAGWERLLEANIEEQLRTIESRLVEEQILRNHARPVLVGRKTLVCTGQAMAAILERTLGVATQLDRALGYEANAGGTSYLNDPLAMLGTFQTAAPIVTVTGNRTAPGQLATVRWDDEGVEPTPFTLVNDGVLTDFQTTRESAAWLAPYYQKKGMPVMSHGCAGSESALSITMQHMPNLAVEPAANGPTLEELISTVADGILLVNAAVERGISDSQARTGVVEGSMRSIKNGRLGNVVGGGALLYDTTQLWKHVTTLGGASTVGTHSTSQYPDGSNAPGLVFFPSDMEKGQPRQLTGHSTTAPAAIITEQAIINQNRRI